MHTLGEEQFADARQQVIRVETVVSKPTLRLHELTKLQRLLVIVFLAEFEVFPPATLDELLRPFHKAAIPHRFQEQAGASWLQQALRFRQTVFQSDMMENADAVDNVEALRSKARRRRLHDLGRNSVSDVVELRPLTGDANADFRNINSAHAGAELGEVNGFLAHAATQIQQGLVADIAQKAGAELPPVPELAGRRILLEHHRVELQTIFPTCVIRIGEPGLELEDFRFHSS